METRVVVGLGNPGPDYAGTRHNVGFAVAHLLADRLGAGPYETTRTYASWSARLGGGAGSPEAGRSLVLLTPLTFMNLSGRALEEYRERHGLEVEQVLVVVDDIYLPLGQVRLRARGGDGGHNGLASLEQGLGTDAYARLRVGVGEAGDGQQLVDHVLSGFAPEEEEALAAALDAACEASLLWAREGIVAGMNRFNARPRPVRENAPEGER
ncbi:MAG: aminoacyl-tRNA hydrolase [Candidatus Eisenbacteria bacterium]